jgi:hypothetical protein
MRKEEQQILPLAEKRLVIEDWRAIEAAFAENEDPIARLRKRNFDRLYHNIGRMVFDRHLRADRRRESW